MSTVVFRWLYNVSYGKTVQACTCRLTIQFIENIDLNSPSTGLARPTRAAIFMAAFYADFQSDGVPRDKREFHKQGWLGASQEGDWRKVKRGQNRSDPAIVIMLSVRDPSRWHATPTVAMRSGSPDEHSSYRQYTQKGAASHASPQDMGSHAESLNSQSLQC